MLVIHHQGERIDLIPAAHIPVTLNGIADFNIANALAAAAMCFLHGVPVDTIRESLATLTNSFSDSPGPLTIRDAPRRRSILDHPPNPAGERKTDRSGQSVPVPEDLGGPPPPTKNTTP